MGELAAGAGEHFAFAVDHDCVHLVGAAKAGCTNECSPVSENWHQQGAVNGARVACQEARFNSGAARWVTGDMLRFCGANFPGANA